VIATRSKETYDKLRLFRNHGLSSRDDVEIFGLNSRLDSLQAVVGNRLIDEVYEITDQRIANAQELDRGLSDLGENVIIPPRKENVKQVYHTYVIQVKNRDALLGHLLENGVDAKVHYPVPLHLQPAAKYLGYKAGDFPVCEEHCRSIISLPAHQHLRPDEIEYMIDCVREFYLG
jgi:aminotransferase EvaB